MDFAGATFDREHDQRRLASLLGRVKDLMSDGKYRTLLQIKAVVGGSEAGISARLRDLRKEQFGSYLVNRRRRGNPSYGVWEYQLIIPEAVFNYVTEPNGQRAFL